MGTSEPEFVLMKDTVWKLSSRVLLLEGFIKQQFGSVFWEFCEEQVKSEGGLDQEDDEGEFIEEKIAVTNSILPMPPMIPIPQRGGNVKGQVQGGKDKEFKESKIPPPPPLAHVGGGGRRVQPPRNNNFLHKKLPPSITITPSNNNGVLREKISDPSNITVVKQEEAPTSTPVSKKGRSITTRAAALSVRPSNNITPSSKNKNQTPTSKSKSSIPAPPSDHNDELELQEELQSSEYYSDDHEHIEDQADDGFMFPSELVSTALQEDEEDFGDDIDEPEYHTRHHRRRNVPAAENIKKARLSLPGTSSTSLSLHNGSLGAHGHGARQMRPNPCHARCQNRCHDIWTDGDRMGVFQTYWSIPGEEERREFVASRIERVDMATKRTEFSNFRTCTFKYYLPHPDNPWVQVCKNFFLATIDEKRSYIEKIAQSVKGDVGEKVSAKDIPFRRRNQMQRGSGPGGELAMDNYMGWMQGLGLPDDHYEVMEDGTMMVSMDEAEEDE